MLKVFRDNLKSLRWVLWLVVLIMVLFVFAQWGGGGQLSGTGRRDVAAQVGNRRITVGEFQRAYEQTDARYRQMFGERYTPELARQLGVAQQVIDQLVSRQLLLQEARHAGLTVTDEELRRAIQQIPSFQDERGRWVGAERFRELLTTSGYTVSDFESALREDLLVQKLQNTLRQGLYIPTEDLEQAFREQTERAEIRYVSLPAGDLLAQVKLEKGAAQRYFKDHAEQFRFPERRVADYLLVGSQQVAQGLTLEPSELRNWYDENIEQFTQPEQVHARHILLRTAERSVDEAREEMAQIRRRIEGGEEFEAVAKEVSEDPGSGEQGGDLGFFSREDMVAPFSEAAFGAAPGELVGPVETQFGVHLIQVVERREGGTTPFEEVRAQIESRLRRERAATATEESARSLATRLAAGDTSSATLERLATEDQTLSLGTTPPFGREDHVPEIGRANEFTEAAFQLAVGEVSEAVRLPSGWAVLVLREIQAPRLPKFAEVRDQVVEAVKQQRALELDEGDLAGPLRTADAAVVFEVTSRTRFDRQAFAEQRSALRDQLATTRLNTLLSSKIQAQRDDLDVELNQELLAQVEGGTGGSSTGRVWSSEHGHWHDANTTEGS